MSDRDQTPSEVDFKRQWDGAQEHQREEWAWQMFDALNASAAPVEPPVLSRARERFEKGVIAQKRAFAAQSGPGDRAELAGIAAAATREMNDARRAYEAAILESLS